MSQLGNAADKNRFEGIGAASAKAVLALFASSPSTAFLSTGITGRIASWFISGLFSKMASVGLVIMNIGAAKVETLIDGNKFEGTLDSAEALIKAIRDTGRDLTPEEIVSIDDPVIAAFRKWASFGRKKK